MTQPVIPQAFYADVTAAAAWLQRVFGFEEEWRLDADDGRLLMANLLTPGGGRVMVSGALGSSREGFGDGSRPNPTYSLTVLVPDVDAHVERARSEGARIVAEPADQPWGWRDYEALDLEGRQWNFSQEGDSASPEDWGATRSQDQ